MDKWASYQKTISEGIKKIRHERRFTQEEFAKLLGLSQPKFSKVESGTGSITAEQFLYILQYFNVPISNFLKKVPAQEDLALQNALARLGAKYLLENKNILVPEKYEKINEVIFDALAIYPTARLITALAPVFIRNVNKINFNQIENKLSAVGYENRLLWVCEGTLNGIKTRRQEQFLPRNIKKLYTSRDTLTLFSFFSFKSFIEKRELNSSPEDILDSNVSSEKTLEILKSERDELARKWKIITSIKQNDFNEALMNAENYD